MSDKELLKLLGLEDRTISIGLDDEYARIVLEKRIDGYLKKLDEEKKKQEQIEFLKGSHSEFKEKEKLLEMLLSKHVMNKLVDRLIREGFSYNALMYQANMKDLFNVIQNITRTSRDDSDESSLIFCAIIVSQKEVRHHGTIFRHSSKSTSLKSLKKMKANPLFKRDK